MLNVLVAVFRGFSSLFRSRLDNALYIAALEQQLAMLLRERSKPRAGVLDRVLCITLKRHWPGWQRALVVFKPATVVAWHRKGYRFFWKWRSKFGRPAIPRAHIDLIRAISRQHPELGEDQIALELETKLGVRHSASTVRRYRWRAPNPERGPKRSSQSWRTFLNNHADAIWDCDFVVQSTACFVSVYIFVIVELDSRRIVWINTTTSPSLDWVKAQIRQACPFDQRAEVSDPRQ